MEILRIRLLGRFELELGDTVLPAFPTRTAKSLFCHLVLRRGEMIPRSVLLGRFWRDFDEGRARRNLRTALWRVRGVLEATGAADSYVRVERDSIGFCPALAYWLDVEAFEQGRDQLYGRMAMGDAPAAGEAERVMRLYRSDLLDDCYDDWCTFDRERLRLEYLTLLEQLAVCHAERREWERALEFARRLLHHDPLREHVHRLVMRCHWGAGNRPAALRHYDVCVRLLREELGAVPMRETAALRDAIWQEHESIRYRPPADAREPLAEQVIARDMLRDLDAAASRIDFARACLTRSILSRDPDEIV